MRRAFVDTSAWFAYANRADRHHASVISAIDSFASQADTRLTTSNFIVDEVLSLTRYRLGHTVATRVGKILLETDAIDLVRITPDDERQAWSLFRARADQRYSFTDCTSFVLMRRLGIDLAIALDGDFAAEGFGTLPNL